MSSESKRIPGIRRARDWKKRVKTMVTGVNLRLAFRSKERTLNVNDPVRCSEGRVRYPYRSGRSK